MLADSNAQYVQSGALASDLYRPSTWLQALVEFIKEQLPLWRDRPDRVHREGENILTSQLCAHMNSATRKASGWDVLQFRTEEPDEVRLARRIDLVPAPSGAVIWIEGRRYSDFDTLLPIECKRLPTPNTVGRDRREYLRTAIGATGGVQRFKAGHHGGQHVIGAMIGYVQSGDIATWVRRVDTWIRTLVRAAVSGWSLRDHLVADSHDVTTRICTLKSIHAREGGLPDISLHHLWIELP